MAMGETARVAAASLAHTHRQDKEEEAPQGPFIDGFSRYRFLLPRCAYQHPLLNNRLRPRLCRLPFAGRPHRLV